MVQKDGKILIKNYIMSVSRRSRSIVRQKVRPPSITTTSIIGATGIMIGSLFGSIARVLSKYYSTPFTLDKLLSSLNDKQMDEVCSLFEKIFCKRYPLRSIPWMDTNVLDFILVLSLHEYGYNVELPL
jgi:hypothetical protein